MRGVFGVLGALLFALGSSANARPALTGVNLAGAEFGGLKGQHGFQYIYPSVAEIRAFDALGVSVFRVPVRWERLQPELGGGLDPAEAARLDAVIATASDMGISVIVDIHNYGRYRRRSIVTDEVPREALPQLWERLARRYKANPRVIFGLMNEPIGIGATDWAGVAAKAVASIRATGATNLILVPGVIWSGAHSWNKRVGLQSNAEALAGFAAPSDNIAFDFHQYFDQNSSGTSVECVTIAEAERRLTVATDWLRKTGSRGFLSEFGVAASDECQPVLRAALAHMAKHPQWLGWTAWASSAWFGTYAFNLYPLQAVVPPQLATMRPFFAPR